MTGRARRGKSLVLSDRCIPVALLALHYSVRTKERKSVEVLLDRLNRYLPTEDGVALRAIGAELTAMNIRVAIRAILWRGFVK